MGLFHRRELLIRFPRAFLVPLLVAALACGSAEDVPDSDAPDSTAPDVAPAAAAPGDSAITLVGSLPEGGPMPQAENAGGVPPYPGASVHTSRGQTEGMRTFEAYTPDDWMQVVAFFDSHLGPPGWSRVQAEDMVIYEKGEDLAAITVSPWEAQYLRPGAPQFMQVARTAIGVAWRP